MEKVIEPGSVVVVTNARGSHNALVVKVATPKQEEIKESLDLIWMVDGNEHRGGSVPHESNVKEAKRRDIFWQKHPTL